MGKVLGVEFLLPIHCLNTANHKENYVFNLYTIFISISACEIDKSWKLVLAIHWWFFQYLHWT